MTAFNRRGRYCQWDEPALQKGDFMKDTFLYTIQAILPILFIILSGYAVRRIGPWTDDFYRQMNALCFRFFLPIQLFCNVYSIDNLSAMNWRGIGYMLSGVFVSLLLGALAAHLFIESQGQKGVIIQNAFRSNQSILGLPLATALGGEPALAFAAMTTSVCVPLYNILAVIVLTVFGSDGNHRPSFQTLLRRIATNPLVLGGLTGILVVALRQFLPTVDGVPVFTIRNQLPSLFSALTSLSKVASPAMLFILGCRFDFSAGRELLPQLTLGVLLRLVICPAIIIGMALVWRTPLGLTAVEMPTLVAMNATPVAVSSAVMAQEMGCDDQLASQLVVWTSVFSIITVFCIVYILRFCGFL